MQNSPAVSPPGKLMKNRSTGGRVVACVDNSAIAGRVVLHALAVARALDASITLLRVIEARPTGAAPTDPVEWNIRRYETRDSLKRLADASSGDDEVIDVEVIGGETAEQIYLWASAHAADFIALGTHGEGGSNEYCLGGTVRHVVDRAPVSVLLVPPSAAGGRVAPYRRILVPLDGSSRAESVLPLAIRLATATDAELLLTHVIPLPELTEIEPLEAEDLELCERVVRRNERVARAYLQHVRARVARGGLRLRVLVLRNGDVRSRLVRAIAEESVDLVVLSSTGHSGRADAPHGSVTAHLLTHPTVPLLIVRQKRTQTMRWNVAADCQGLRLPAYADA